MVVSSVGSVSCRVSGCLVSVLLTVMLLGPANAADWYVSASGSDANPGSSSSAPFRTFAAGIAAANAGDTVHIMNGTYRNAGFGAGATQSNPAVVNINKSGDAVNGPITIRNFAGHAPKIQFDGKYGIFFQSGVTHIVIDGLEIQGPAQNITYANAFANRLNTNAATADYYNGRGIAGFGPHEQVTVRRCVVRDCCASGIRFNKSDYMTIEDCEVVRCCWWSPRAESGIVFAESLPVDASTGVKMIFRRNVVQSNWNRIPFYSPSATNTGSGTFPDYGTAAQTYILDGQGLYVTRSDNSYAGTFLIENNICVNNGKNGINFDGSINATAIIANNTMYMNGAFDFIQSDHLGPNKVAGITARDVAEVTMANNIVVCRNTNYRALTIWDTSPSVVNNNLIENGSINVPLNTGNLVTNALFVAPTFNYTTADFNLQATSPAIDAADPAYAPSDDFFQTSRIYGAGPDIGAIEDSNAPPGWNANPFNQTAATEDVLYTTFVNFRVTDPEGDPLTYALLSGPGWLVLTNPTLGRFDGTPTQADVGANIFSLSVSDGINPPVLATMNINVLPVNDPPEFTTNNFALGNAAVGALFSSSLAGSATDIDGDPLSYSVLSGPAWLALDPAANPPGTAVAGTPAIGDVGTNVFMILVQDPAALADTATVTVVVSPSPNLPPVWSSSSFVQAAASEDMLYSAVLGASASDPENDPLTYSIVSGPAWLSISNPATGALSGTPTQADIGTSTVTFAVADSFHPPVQATAMLEVLPTNDQPMFVNDPIVLGTTETFPFSGTLIGRAVDPDNDPLSYAIVSGPTWLNLTQNGVLSGTPNAADVGTNTFTIEVTDGLSPPVPGTLVIAVAPAPPPPCVNLAGGEPFFSGYHIDTTNQVFSVCNLAPGLDARIEYTLDLSGSGGTQLWFTGAAFTLGPAPQQLSFTNALSGVVQVHVPAVAMAGSCADVSVSHDNSTDVCAMRLVLPGVCPPGSPAARGPLLDGAVLNMTQSWPQATGYVRTAAVRVPNGTGPFPVVIMFHGNGGNDGFINSMGNRLDSVIRVAPNGYLNSWNISAEASQAPDVDFVRELIALINSHSNVDAGDVSLFGSSNGSGMVNRLLIELDGAAFQKAVGFVSQMTTDMHNNGSFWFNASGNNNYDQMIAPAVGRKICAISGDADPLIPYAGGNGVGTTFMPALESIYRFAQLQGFSGTQIPFAAGVPGDGVNRHPDLVEYAYLGGDVVHYRMVGGNHGLAPHANEARDIAAAFLLQ